MDFFSTDPYLPKFLDTTKLFFPCLVTHIYYISTYFDMNGVQRKSLDNDDNIIPNRFAMQ